MGLRAVFFDLDETLVDAGPCFHEANRRAFAAFQMDYDEAFRRTGSFYGFRVIEILARRRDAMGLTEADAPAATLFAMREDLYIQLLPGMIELLPGAREAVTAVHEAGLTSAVVSSASRRCIAAVLEHFELRQAVTFLVGGDELEVGKPHPDPYELAFRRLSALTSASKTGCLVVEDSVAGFQSARAAALPVCLVPLHPPDVPLDPEYQLASLTEFPALLDRLL